MRQEPVNPWHAMLVVSVFPAVALTWAQWWLNATLADGAPWGATEMWMVFVPLGLWLAADGACVAWVAVVLGPRRSRRAPRTGDPNTRPPALAAPRVRWLLAAFGVVTLAVCVAGTKLAYDGMVSLLQVI